MISKYINVTTVRISEIGSGTAGSNYNAGSFTPDTSPGSVPQMIQNPDGTYSVQSPQNQQAGLPSTPAPGSTNDVQIVFQDRPTSKMDVGKVLFYHRFYNKQTDSYESNVLEVYLAGGMVPVYIRMTASALNSQLYSTPVATQTVLSATESKHVI